MKMNRRRLLQAGATAVTAACINPLVFAKNSPAVDALDKSALIYLTPILSNGNESQCHGEVWFVHHDNEIFVVTQTTAWRAEAIRKGLTEAAIWIGEFGAWTRAKDKYRSAPYLRIDGRLEEDEQVHAQLLTLFGKKYSKEWGSWGPRFQQGLAEGSRVMLRYRRKTSTL